MKINLLQYFALSLFHKNIILLEILNVFPIKNNKKSNMEIV